MHILYTVGHSNRSFDQLAATLTAAGIELLVDVRAYPRSKRNPQFDRTPLAGALEAIGIDYRFAGRALGGKRELATGNPHCALTGDAFKAYAAHMDSAEFRAALARLETVAGQRRLVFMCAERNPGDCHRSLIADYLLSRGHRVCHLIQPGESHEHCHHPALRQVGNSLRYDRNSQASFDL